MRAGAPYSPSRTPANAALYLDVRLAADADVLRIQEELRQLARKRGIAADVEMYLFRRGYESRGTERLSRATTAACRRVLESQPAAPPTPYVSMWRDRNILEEVGIPAISFGPPRSGGRDTNGPYGLYIEKRDLVAAAKMYALLALDICNQDR
jgi:acetylornithine deacetylase/succinyl-diaminopimelate desuccinylase-like protein